MKRLVWLFQSLGSAAYGSKVDWNPETKALNHYASIGMFSEGFWYMFKQMIERKIVDEVLIIIESARGPGSTVYGTNFKCVVMPSITDIWQFLRPSDLILVRGGFKSWYPILQEMQKQKRWLMFYRAASQRGNWPFWDIILDDLREESFVDSWQRLYLPFMKPTHPGIFKPMRLERDFDVCIGASHIHDKKGQWKMLPVLLEYRKQFGKILKAVMPGSLYGGVHTNDIPSQIRRNNLDVSMPGMVQRDEVAQLYNRSKTFVHLGVAGQNDRGVLEAMRCGTPVVIANPRFHAPFTFKNTEVSMLTENSDNPAELAKELHDFLQGSSIERYDKVFKYHEEKSGLENVILPYMEKLVNFMTKYPEADRSKTGELI